MVIINLIQKWKLCGDDNLRLCLRIPYKKKNSNVNALYLQFLDYLASTRRT